jgi:SAM-dependent methyltransferase
VRLITGGGQVHNLLIKDYTEYVFLTKYGLLAGNKRLLNAGSSSVRYGQNCVNVDIQPKPGVDVVCDIHDLPDSLGRFDAIVCNAVLQYCRNPRRVADEFHRVLELGGYLFVDAPWVQPFCPDKPDLFRFSEDALKSIFSSFEIIEIGPSIRSGSAFAMLGVYVAGTLTSNKYVNYALRSAATFILYPFRWIRTAEESKTAGAFYMICRKSEWQGRFTFICRSAQSFWSPDYARTLLRWTPAG